MMRENRIRIAKIRKFIEFIRSSSGVRNAQTRITIIILTTDIIIVATNINIPVLIDIAIIVNMIATIKTKNPCLQHFIFILHIHAHQVYSSGIKI